MKPVKLTWEKVDQIRAIYQPGVVGYKTIAGKFDVSVETIKSVVRGETWKESSRIYTGEH